MHIINKCKVPPRISSVVDKVPHSCDILMHLAHQIHLKHVKTLIRVVKDIYSSIGQATASEHCQLNQNYPIHKVPAVLILWPDLTSHRMHLHDVHDVHCQITHTFHWSVHCDGSHPHCLSALPPTDQMLPDVLQQISGHEPKRIQHNQSENWSRMWWTCQYWSFVAHFVVVVMVHCGLCKQQMAQ